LAQSSFPAGKYLACLPHLRYNCYCAGVVFQAKKGGILNYEGQNKNAMLAKTCGPIS
jgi:hypothetical protein